MTTKTTSQQFFEAKYQQRADPWSFASDTYEQSRYDAIIDALAHRRYQRAFEPGCSIGVLTSRLAELCGDLQAMDISPTAVQQAGMRCNHLANVHLTCGALPEALPPGPFDLIVFSEIGYYLDEPALQTLGTTLVERLTTNGVLLAAHWLGTSEDHILGGDRVHALLGQLQGLAHEHSERHAGFRLDRWVPA